MYLTRMPINTARRGAVKLLASPQAMHAAVLSSFPPEAVLSDPEVGRVLWRIDQLKPHTYLYVLSPERPDLTALVEQAGWPLSSSWETKEYTPLLNRIQHGDEYRFSLVANPVQDLRQSSGRSKRLPHVTEAQQLVWFEDKGKRAGFEIVEAPYRTASEPGVPDVHEELQVRLSERRDRRFRRGERTVTLRTVRFDGLLRVTDSASFREALAHGIGSARGYGCGLMTISRTSGNRTLR